MVKQNETEKANLLDNIDLVELIETTNLDILPNFQKSVIVESDLTTIRRVIINSLPTSKFIKKVGKELLFMTIIYNGIKYSLSADSIALRRSLYSLAIKECNAKTKDDIDLSSILGKKFVIKRREFTSKSGFTASPLQFFSLIE